MGAIRLTPVCADTTYGRAESDMAFLGQMAYRENRKKCQEHATSDNVCHDKLAESDSESDGESVLDTRDSLPLSHPAAPLSRGAA
jgi:hypothetical protein